VPHPEGQPVTSRAGKMGKSLKNGISPDGIYAGYGAGPLRMYEMAMGPLDAGRPWQPHDIVGVHRFLQRLYEMAMGPLDTDRPWRTSDIVGVYRFLQRLWRNVIDENSGAPRVHDQPLDQCETGHPGP
jgi:leucyl-tRNA synthetase